MQRVNNCYLMCHNGVKYLIKQEYVILSVGMPRGTRGTQGTQGTQGTNYIIPQRSNVLDIYFLFDEKYVGLIKMLTQKGVQPIFSIVAQFFLKLLFFELNHDARSNQVSTFKGPFGLLFANSSTTYISSVKSICLIHPYEKLKRKFTEPKLQHID